MQTANTRSRYLLTVSIGVACLFAPLAYGGEPDVPTETIPRFHHVHLNSPDAASAIGEYISVLPESVRTSFAGLPGFKSANGVYFLFTDVEAAPSAALPDRVSAATPQTAFWHFVFASDDIRGTLARLRAEIPDFESRLLPLYTGPDGATVDMSGDTHPGFRTAAQLEAIQGEAIQPLDTGYFNWVGPDGVILEHAQRPDRTNPPGLVVFGMFQEQPLCAVEWYVRHLNAPAPPGDGRIPGKPDGSTCTVERSSVVTYPSTYRRGHVRTPPPTGVTFGDLFLRWYINQEEAPLASMRGSAVDHFALSVPDLDPWIARFGNEGVAFLEGPEPYLVGNYRAVMIEGPSREAIEIIEIRDADAAAVLELDWQAEDALNRMDVAFLSTVFADDLVFTHGDAWTESGSIGHVTSKNQWLEFVANSGGMFSGKNANTQRIEMHGDIAIVQGRSSGRNKGEPYEIWYLRIYERRNGAWKLISHKTVRGPQPPTDVD